MPRRPDEVPWLEVTSHVLAGYCAGLLLFLIGGALRVVDDGLAHFDEETP